MSRLPLFIAIVLLFVSCMKENADLDNHLHDSYEEASGDLILAKDIVPFIDSVFLEMNTDIWVSKEIIPANTVFDNFLESFSSPGEDSWMIFIDLIPEAYWSHKCLYRFVGVHSGRVVDIYGKYPPKREAFSVIKEVVRNNGQVIRLPVCEHRTIRTEDNTKWAVLLCGGPTVDLTYETFWNDCSRVYQMLVYKFGYPENHIKVLMTDGVNPGVDRILNNKRRVSSPIDLDGNGTTDIDYSLTKSNISAAFSAIGNSSNLGDDVFVYVMTHGENGRILLWDPNQTNSTGASLTANELSLELNKFSGRNVNIWMGQCKSGSFISPLSGKYRTIATACKAEENAYPRVAMDYSEFSYQWCNAIEGESPYATVVDADSNYDGDISFWEAFNYAEDFDSQNETPQYSESYSNQGYNFGLSGELFVLPKLEGPSDIRCNGTGVYSVNGSCPNIISIDWSHSPELSYCGSSSNSISLRPNVQNQILPSLSVSASVNLPDKTISITKSQITSWRSGINFTSTLLEGTLSSAGGSIAVAVPWWNIYDYFWSSDYFEPEFQGSFFTNFIPLTRSDLIECYVTVSFTNPLGDNVVLVREYSF